MRIPRTLWFILGGGLFIRLGLAFYFHRPIAPGGDSQVYLDMALSFLRHQFSGQQHPPLFPLFLAVCLHVFQGSFSAALAVQCVLSASGIALTYWIVQRMGFPQAALWSAAWVAIDPFQIYYSTVFLSETVFTICLVAAFGATLGAAQLASRRWSLASGILLALSTLARGIVLPCVPLFPCYVGFYSQGTTARRLLLAALCIAGFLLPMLVWVSYIHRQTGKWVLVDSHKGETLYWGVHAPIDGAPGATEQLYRETREELAALGIHDPAAGDVYLRNKAIRLVKEHPGAYLLLSARKILKFWSPFVNRYVFSPLQRLVSVLFMIPLLIFAGWGALRVWRQKPVTPEWILLFGVVLVYLLVNVVFWTEVRYRIPIHPFLEILAGYAIGTGLARHANRL